MYLSACIPDLPNPDQEGRYRCSSDGDCKKGYFCRNGFCSPEKGEDGWNDEEVVNDGEIFIDGDQDSWNGEDGGIGEVDGDVEDDGGELGDNEVWDDGDTFINDDYDDRDGDSPGDQSTQVSPLESAQFIIKVVLGNGVDVNAVAVNRGGAVIDESFAVWEEPMPSMFEGLPATVIKHAIQFNGDYYIGVIGETNADSLASLALYDEWWGLSANIKDTVLFRFLRLNYQELLSSGLVPSGDIDAFETEIHNQTDQTASLLFSMVVLMHSYNGEWGTGSPTLEYWAPIANAGNVDGTASRTFQISYNGSTASYIFGSGHHDNGNGVRLRLDEVDIFNDMPSSPIITYRHNAKNEFPSSVEMAISTSWSEADVSIHVLTLGGSGPTCSNVSESPGGGVTDNTCPSVLILSPGVTRYSENLPQSCQ
jgi:hypothetical protein